MSVGVNRAGQAARLALRVNLTTERARRCAVARARVGLFPIFLLERNTLTIFCVSSCVSHKVTHRGCVNV